MQTTPDVSAVTALIDDVVQDLILPKFSRLLHGDIEAGSGAFLNGERIRVPPGLPDGPPRGSLLVRYMPEALRETVTGHTRGRFRLIPSSGCAAVEYTGILRGERDFAVYYRLLPWDHAAPALILAVSRP